jgi:hypothetical protein
MSCNTCQQELICETLVNGDGFSLKRLWRSLIHSLKESLLLTWQSLVPGTTLLCHHPMERIVFSFAAVVWRGP